MEVNHNVAIRAKRKRERDVEYSRQYRAQKKALLSATSANNDNITSGVTQPFIKIKERVQSTTVLLKM
jgi:hypothetical protein